MPFTGTWLQFSANTFRHLVGWPLGPHPGFNQCVAALADDSQWCRGIDKLKDALKKGKATTVTWNSSLARNLGFVVAEENDLYNDQNVINGKWWSMHINQTSQDWLTIQFDSRSKTWQFLFQRMFHLSIYWFSLPRFYCKLWGGPLVGGCASFGFHAILEVCNGGASVFDA